MLLMTAGENGGVEALYDRYAAMLYRLALSMLKNREDAEDAVQNVFEKYVAQPHLFLSAEHEKSWMLRVTMNACKDSLRRRAVRRSAPLEAVAEEGAWDNYGEVLDMVHRLPEEYRAVILLHYFEEQKVEEIARILKIGTSAVKMRLKRGRELMKKEWEGDGHDR